jgi:hypothetical protein
MLAPLYATPRLCGRLEGFGLDRIAIIGGARLEGEIPISGAKNSAIKLMAASLLTEEALRLTNMPRGGRGRTGDPAAHGRDHQRLRAL